MEQKDQDHLAAPCGGSVPGLDAATDHRMTERLQQKCSDWGTYWRAPDAHGVVLTQQQALELLRDALGVEVELQPPCRPLTNDQIDALYLSKLAGKGFDNIAVAFRAMVRAVESAHGIGGASPSANEAPGA